MTTQKGRSGSCPDVLSELKIAADRAFPEPGQKTKRKSYPRTLGKPDPTQVSRAAAELYHPYVVKPNGELKPRPEKFCQLIAEGKSGHLESYLKAGYTDSRYSPQNAWLLEQKPEVAARIAQLKSGRHRLETATHGEVHQIIADIDAGREPDIDHKVLLRQWAVNLDLARKAGDTLQANRALGNIQKLADYDSALLKSKVTATTHPEDNPDAEAGNHKAVEDIFEDSDDDGRTRTPPSPAELAEVLLQAGRED